MDRGQEKKSPEQFTKDMPEGEGSGSGAPETVEPTQGRPGAGGHGPAGAPGGPAMKDVEHEEE